MKKLIIGCGVLCLLFCLAGAGVALFLYRKAMEVKAQVEATNARYEQVSAAHPFQPPVPALLDKERFELWLQVHEGIADIIQKDLGVLARFAAATQGNPDGSPDAGKITWGEMLSVPDAIRRVPEAHIAALEKHNMSAAEYLWISKVVYGTAAKLKVSEQSAAARNLGTQLDLQYRELLKSWGVPVPVGAVETEPGAKAVGVLEMALEVDALHPHPANIKLLEENHDRILKTPQVLWFDLYLMQRRNVPFEDAPTKGDPATPGEPPATPSAGEAPAPGGDGGEAPADATRTSGS